eukprot:ctg_214.g138
MADASVFESQLRQRQWNNHGGRPAEGKAAAERPDTAPLPHVSDVDTDQRTPDGGAAAAAVLGRALVPPVVPLLGIVGHVPTVADRSHRLECRPTYRAGRDAIQGHPANRQLDLNRAAGGRIRISRGGAGRVCSPRHDDIVCAIGPCC